jgi:hypothetical protein
VEHFVSSYTRRVQSDLAGLVALNGSAANPYMGALAANMGGSPVLMPTESEGVELLVRPSVSVPDDPVRSTVGDILAHNVTVHARVTPRHHLVSA